MAALTELNEHFHLYPEPTEVFSPEQPWLRDHFAPLLRMDLAEIRPELAGTQLTLVAPYEPYDGYIREGTLDYHNDFIGPNWISFHLEEDGTMKFMGEEGYFLHAPVHKNHKWRGEDFDDYIQKMRESYINSKAYWEEHRLFVRYSEYEEGPVEENEYLAELGGPLEYGNWSEPDILPEHFVLTFPPEDEWECTLEDKEGNTFIKVCEVAGYNYLFSGADAIIMLYEPKTRIILFTFDYS